MQAARKDAVMSVPPCMVGGWEVDEEQTRGDLDTWILELPD